LENLLQSVIHFFSAIDHVSFTFADETYAFDWSQIQPAQVEVLILKLHTKQYSLPEWIAKMSKQKVLITTNYSFHPSKLNNIELLGSL